MNQSFFPFSTRNFKNRNMLLNILILMMILALKSIKMKETAVNYFIWVELRINLENAICTRNEVLYATVVISVINFFGGENRFTQGNKLSDCSGIWAHNHLVTNRTHNHLAELTKWFSCVVSTYLYDAFGCVILSCHILVLEWIHTLQLPDYQEIACSNQARYRKFK